MPVPFPSFPLETDRLLLRPPLAQDFDAWARFQADPVVTRHLGGVQDRSTAWRTFCTQGGAWALYGFGMFTVIEKASGNCIGRLGPWRPEGWPGTEVGWGLLLEAQGKGYAVEGATAAIDFAFAYLGWEEVIHCIAPENLASQKVAQALGSANRGPGQLPGPLADKPIEIWGQTQAQWRARRAALA